MAESRVLENNSGVPASQGRKADLGVSAGMDRRVGHGHSQVVHQVCRRQRTEPWMKSEQVDPAM